MNFTSTISSFQRFSDKIFDDLEGYRRSAILATSIALGIFDQLADGKNNIAEISEAIKAPVRSTRIILQFAKQNAAELNLEERVEYVSGNIFDVAFGNNFEIAIASLYSITLI